MASKPQANVPNNQQVTPHVQNGEDALPAPVARRGIDEPTWRTLKNSIYPGASGDSILMAVDYCRARKLDVLKKPCHIVPMNVKDAKTGKYEWRDVILPGVYEYRITAHRTGLYIGRSHFEYGDTIQHLGAKVPEWCEVSVYRLFKADSNERMEFRVRCYFSEVCNTKKEKDGSGQYTGELLLNERWSRAPIQMMTKCTEAAALREAFPDEIGGEGTEEEMAGRVVEGTVTEPTRTLKPATIAPQARAIQHQSAETQPAKFTQPEGEKVAVEPAKAAGEFQSLASEPQDEEEAGSRG